MSELQAMLNTLAGTTGLDAQGAANRLAGTTGLDLPGALNTYVFGANARSSWLDVAGVCNKIAGTTGYSAQGALSQHPSTISGLQIWLNANRLGLADGASVATWTDLSANGWSATATTQPTYKTNIVNGKAVVRFVNASAQYMVFLSASYGALRNREGMSVVAVVRAATTSTIIRVFSTENTGNADMAFISANSSAGQWRIAGRRLTADTLVATEAGASTVDTANFQILAHVRSWSAATDKMWVNGTLKANKDPFQTAGNSQDADAINMELGRDPSPAGQYFDGDIAEFMLFNRTLTTAERQQAERAMGAKYGITVP